jgi:hypothetical protein
MTCAGFREIVVDLARELRPEGREEALAHAASCPGCGGRLAEQRQLTAALRALSAEDQEAEAPAALETRLRRALHEASPPARERSARWGGWGWAGLAAAAASLALFGWWWQGQPATAPSHDVAQTATDGEDGAFLPVTYGDALAGADAMQVVRVRLPRAALGGMGLAVPGGPEPGVVEADVLVSQDGVTHGIRLVPAAAGR